MTIDRGPEPDVLRSDLVKLAIEKMREFYLSEDRSQRRYEFPFNDQIDDLLKPRLREVFYSKCGYCDVKIYSPQHGFVDRFRPYSGIRDKQQYFPDLYWWLTFSWDNLVYCCKECLQYKANYFPIEGKRAMTETDDLDKEKYLLLDPCKDDRDKHLDYEEELVRATSDRGAQTLELLRLNRHSHKVRRSGIINELTDLIVDIATGTAGRDRSDYILRIHNGDPTLEFLFCQQAMLEKAKAFTSIRRLLNIQVEKKKKGKPTPASKISALITSDFFPLEYIRIQHFKGITDLTIHFREDDIQKKSWLFLLGENGAGKSSILQAIAIGVKADTQFLEPLIPRLIQKGKQTARITVKERNSEKVITTVLTRKAPFITQTGPFNSFLLGYGSLRLSVEEADTKTSQDKSRISYENLFRPTQPLNDITRWLRNLQKKNPVFFDAVAYSIKQLLPHDFSGNELTVEKGEILFKNSKKLFSELSDGFKSTIILAVDIMMKLSSAHADMDKMTGIVLIDELGNQLHPRWQMRIVRQLRTVFRNINFIVSTHHPLCLRGAENEEILLLKNVNEELVSVTDLPDPSHLRVDQLLASEFFGLSSLIDPDLEARFNRYYELVAKEENISPEERIELNHLKDELRRQKQLGGSLREELMYTVIDRLLASKVIYDKKPSNREELKKEVVRRVGDIWNKLNVDKHDQDHTTGMS